MKTLLAITLSLSVAGLVAQAADDKKPAPPSAPPAPTAPGTPALPTTPTAPPLPEQFKKYDVNGNGKLDQEEIAAIRKDRETETLKKYDKNGDGKLDETEKAVQMEDMKKRREEILARRKTQLEKPTEKPTDKPVEKK